MNTIENIKKISLIFFIASGFLHLSSSMMIANDYMLKTAFIINRTMDIPFIFTGLLYGFSSIRLNFSENKSPHKVLDISLLGVVILVIAGVIAINFIFPDK